MRHNYEFCGVRELIEFWKSSWILLDTDNLNPRKNTILPRTLNSTTPTPPKKKKISSHLPANYWSFSFSLCHTQGANTNLDALTSFSPSKTSSIFLPLCRQDDSTVRKCPFRVSVVASGSDNRRSIFRNKENRNFSQETLMQNHRKIFLRSIRFFCLKYYWGLNFHVKFTKWLLI